MLFFSVAFGIALGFTPLARAEKPNTVVIDNRQITGITDVYVATESTICVAHEGKSEFLPIEKFREDFLRAWGISDEDIEKGMAEVKKRRALEARTEARMKELGLSRAHIAYFDEAYRQIICDGSDEEWRDMRPKIEATWKEYEARRKAQQEAVADFWKNMNAPAETARATAQKDDGIFGRSSEPTIADARAARDYLIGAIQELKMQMLFETDVFMIMRISNLIKEHQKTLDEICRKYGLSQPGFKRLGD